MGGRATAAQNAALVKAGWHVAMSPSRSGHEHRATAGRWRVGCARTSRPGGHGYLLEDGLGHEHVHLAAEAPGGGVLHQHVGAAFAVRRVQEVVPGLTVVLLCEGRQAVSPAAPRPRTRGTQGRRLTQLASRPVSPQPQGPQVQAPPPPPQALRPSGGPSHGPCRLPRALRPRHAGGSSRLPARAGPSSSPVQSVCPTRREPWGPGTEQALERSLLDEGTGIKPLRAPTGPVRPQGGSEQHAYHCHAGQKNPGYLSSGEARPSPKWGHRELVRDQSRVLASDSCA